MPALAILIRIIGSNYQLVVVVYQLDQLHIQTFILRTLNQYDAQIADVIPRTKELKNKQSQTSDWMGCLQIYTMTLPNVWWYLLTDTDSSNPFICMPLERVAILIKLLANMNANALNKQKCTK